MSVLIVGGGVAAVALCRRLRERGYLDSISMLEAESTDPYDRPPLSKQVLRDPAHDPVVATAAQLAELGISWHPGTTAIALRPAENAVDTATGRRFIYQHLVLATGSVARRLPGLNGLTLRTWADAMTLRDSVSAASTVVVVGAGLIGCEVAASLRAIGAEVHLMDTAARPMIRVLGPALAADAASLHERHGVRWRPEVTVVAHDDRNTQLSDGTVVQADVLVQAVGGMPATGWLAGSGLHIGNGIWCDSSQRTSIDGVFAIGDAAARDGVRSEHWTAAGEQADVAAAVILGQDPRPAGPSYWWSDQYDVKFQGLGDVSTAQEMVVGSVDGRRLALFRCEGHLVAAVGVSAPRALIRMRAQIAAKVPFCQATSVLENPDYYPLR